ncbi:uncharacterized protein BXZ73DRAFT_41550 [Epithele typhae]|uniref:uncharacterized protein n=1 Tax=Epithele typhae TaxID=378194 RepID=UPI002008E57F|nr:uncharacterized protein BXZ73DRAFT_41550 [Epithele typhae]KAH9941729.1 hypothetical protein BXZ73DRAFT_41550 [Epithele typhae]
MNFSRDIADLVGFALEAIAWGAYAVLFAGFLVLHSHKRQPWSVIEIVTCILFATCTTHFVLEFHHFVTALESQGVPSYSAETNPLFGADILISVCDLFGDFILLYRCWVIWGRNYWVIVLPSLTAAGGLACIAGFAHLVLALAPGELPPPAMIPLETAAYVLPLCTNVLTTGLILYRIWWASRLGGGRAMIANTRRIAVGAMAVVVESGLLYLVVQLIFVVLVALDSDGLDIVIGLAVPVYGIAPTLIIIRVALGLSVEAITSPDTVGSSRLLLSAESAGLSRGQNMGPTASSLGGCTKHDGSEMKALSSSAVHVF